MKSYFVCCLLLCAGIVPGYSQKKDNISYSYFNEDHKSSNAKKAMYLDRLINKHDTAWQLEHYYSKGPLILVETFKDKACKIPHGRFIFYNDNGIIDSIGFFSNNLRNGKWFYYNDTGRTYMEKGYERGKLVYTRDLLKTEKAFEKMPDSLEVVESTFNGGISGWGNYLRSNLKYPKHAIKNEIDGTVVVQFIVDKKGKVLDPVIYKSVEYSLDDTAMDIIINAPNWEPARQNGKKVFSYKRQPIVFRLQ